MFRELRLSLNCFACFLQPQPFVLVEAGGELFVHLAVVLVQPVRFCRGQQAADDAFGADGAEGDGLELQVAAKQPFARRHGEYEVLRADAVTAGLIDARLVAGDHARAQGDGVLVHADALRPFVDVEEVAYAVSRAVQEVHAVLPDGHAGQYVELGAARAFGEDGHSQVDVSL